MLVRSLRCCLGVSSVVGAVAYAVAAAAAPISRTYFRENLVAPGERQFLLLMTLGSAVMAVALVSLLILKGKEQALDSLEWWVRVASPLLVAPWLVALVRHDVAQEIEVAMMLLVLVVGFERLARISLGAWAERQAASPVSAVAAPEGVLISPSRLSLGERFKSFLGRPRVVFGILLALAVGQFTLMFLWALWSHQRFSTYGFDLGQYDSVFASTLHGHPLAMPALGLPGDWEDLTSNHADLVVFFLLPFYALRPDASTLLFFQAAFIAFAAIPIFFFAKRYLSPAVALMIAVAWLAWVPMHRAQLYDYHPQHLGASFALTAVAFAEYRKWIWYWVFFTLAILCREDVSIALCCIGLYFTLTGYRVRTGVATVLVSLTYFVILRFFLMRNTGFTGIYKDLLAPGEAGGFGSILKTMISNPTFSLKTLLTWEKARYVVQLFAPLAFLPLRRAWVWLLYIPGFFLTLLTTDYAPTISISFQYVANWSYMFLAAVWVLAEYQREGAPGLIKQRAALLTVALATMVTNLQWGAYSPRGSMQGGFVEVPLLPPQPNDRARERNLQTLLAQVPADAQICTSDRVQPHTTAKRIHNWLLLGNVEHCSHLLWLDGDRGIDDAHAAIAKGSHEMVERLGDLSLARKKKTNPL